MDAKRRTLIILLLCDRLSEARLSHMHGDQSWRNPNEEHVDHILTPAAVSNHKASGALITSTGCSGKEDGEKNDQREKISFETS